ncbi:MAG: hypothetical protein ACTSP4_14800, partial [Candidatus Hodarchaeales archaeon]
TEGNEYCTGVCCMFATKNAGIIKDELPGTDVTICYIDIRTPGLYYEEYYKATQRKGVRYIRGRPSDILKDCKKTPRCAKHAPGNHHASILMM